MEEITRNIALLAMSILCIVGALWAVFLTGAGFYKFYLYWCTSHQAFEKKREKFEE